MLLSELEWCAHPDDDSGEKDFASFNVKAGRVEVYKNEKRPGERYIYLVKKRTKLTLDINAHVIKQWSCDNELQAQAVLFELFSNP